MGRNNRVLFIAVVAVALGFLIGLVRLFMLGVEYGEFFSPYSSYRSDPLGVRAFYRALGSLPEVSVSRNVKTVTGIGEGRGKTLIFCGADTSRDQEDEIESLEAFVAGGGRLVIMFYPVSEKPLSWWGIDGDDEETDDEGENACKSNGDDLNGRDENDRENVESKDEDSQDNKHDEIKEEPWFIKLVSIEERWGFSYAYSPLSSILEGSDFKEEYATRLSAPAELPDEVSWHTAMFFENMNEQWKVLYSRSGRTVMMERPFGKGTIVLSSDSYFVSNEAMRKERHPFLLVWLVGSSREVVFDEVHLGATERPGIMTLIRNYRLHGFLAALLLMSVLYVWKNLASLVPKRELSITGTLMEDGGLDSTAGLVNLLRRSIPAGKILSVCEQEWSRAFSRDPRGVGGRRDRIKAVVDGEEKLSIGRRDPVGAYKAIYKILSER